MEIINVTIISSDILEGHIHYKFIERQYRFPFQYNKVERRLEVFVYVCVCVCVCVCVFDLYAIFVATTLSRTHFCVIEISAAWLVRAAM